MSGFDVVGHEPEPLHAVAYVSTPTEPFSDRALSDLLLAARRWNAEYGVTGKLVVQEAAVDGGAEVVRFAQWIEGPRTALEACVERILADPRHGAFDVRRRGPVESRRFPGWDMAIEPATGPAFQGRSERLVGDGAK